MKAKLQKVALRFNIAVVGLMLVAPSAVAQSYLDQLESIVKKFGEEPDQKTSEELPPPNSPTRPAPQSAPQIAPAAAEPSTSIYLGLEAEDVTGGGLGVLVTKVTAKSPAWKAGFEVGDRILAVNNFSISGLDQMADRLFKLSPGDTCQFLVTRGTRNIKLTAVLLDSRLASKTLGVTPPATEERSVASEPGGKAWVGLLVNDLTAAFRAQFGQRVSRGAAVTSVTRGSPAWEAGIRAGDCITDFAQQPISGAEDMIGMLGVLQPGQLVEVIYYRGVIRRTANITLTTQPGTSSAPRQAPRVPVNPSVVTNPGAMPPAKDASGQGASVLPKVDDSNRDSGTGLQLPPFLLPVDAGDSAPVERKPPDKPEEKSGSADARVAELERTVEELRRELDAKNKQIDDMQRRLQGILQSLGGGR